MKQQEYKEEKIEREAFRANHYSFIISINHEIIAL
jgi:hypothetical protein